MFWIANSALNLLPIGALLLLVYGLHKKAIYYVISSLWLSLITLFIHLRNSGGTLLGDYFNSTNALMCSISLLVFASATVYLIALINSKKSFIKSIATLIQACIVLITLLVIVNLGINAYFITYKLEGSPIIQVALIEKPSYCNYDYVFYKITEDGATDYLCPNYYKYIPKIGHLEVSPDFITMQLSLPIKKRLLLLQQKKR